MAYLKRLWLQDFRTIQHKKQYLKREQMLPGQMPRKNKLIRSNLLYGQAVSFRAQQKHSLKGLDTAIIRAEIT